MAGFSFESILFGFLKKNRKQAAIGCLKLKSEILFRMLLVGVVFASYRTHATTLKELTVRILRSCLVATCLTGPRKTIG